MEIVDFHVHVVDTTRIEDIVGPMAEFGISKSVLLGIDQGERGRRYGLYTSDETVANLVRQAPDRLIGFSSIHTEHGVDGCIAKLERAVKELGLRGLKIYPHGGVYPNDPILMPVYGRARDLKIPVLMHTGIKALRHQHMKYNHPLPVDDIATEFPDLDLMIAHVGYPWVDEALLIARLNPNVWFDITFLDTLEEVMKEEILYPVLRRIKNVVGLEQIVWGTEGAVLSLPLYPEQGPSRMRSSINRILSADFLTDDEKEAILGKNALRLFARHTGEA